MENFKAGFVALVGKANVGKSTLLNNILKQKVTIVSPKPQTTRNKIIGILNKEDAQIIFIDTPGMHKSKSKLDDYMDKSIKSSLEDVDVVVYMLDAGKKIDEEELSLIENYAGQDKKIIIGLNKIDEISVEKQVKYLTRLNALKGIDIIIPLSAKKGKNVDELIVEIQKYLPFGPAYYDRTQVTDKSLRFLCSEIIREKTLYFLQQEVPHGIAVVVEQFIDNNHIVKIDANIVAEKKSHKNIIIGKNGEMLKKIGSVARKEIEFIVGKKVFLSLWVKIKESWRDNEFELKNLGYNKTDL